MFIGHYGPALALKPAGPQVKLWHLVVAVQLLDYGWAGFILSGVEKARVVPGFLAASDLDLYYMPWTHSLAGASLISVLAGAVYALLLNRPAGGRGGIVIAAAVFSHWLADLLVHAPDLQLFPGSETLLGFSLWSSVLISQGLELAFVVLGTVLYARATRATSTWGLAAPWVLLGVLIALQVYNLLAPAPTDIRGVAISALAAYSVLAALAFAVDRGRTPAGIATA